MSVTTDKQVIDERLDLEMLERPHLWPGEVVFVKRNNGAQTGPCRKTATGGYAIRVHDWREGGEQSIASYPNAGAVVADGWKVD
jgi:hypothetical protein